MKDTEMRGLLLRKYYDHRREDWWYPSTGDLNNLLADTDIFYVSEQLAELGLLEWKPLRQLGSEGGIGMGHITAAGVDVVEGVAQPPPSIEIRNYTVSGANFGIVGDNNQQSIEIAIEKIVSAINNSSVDEGSKAEAKGLLRKFLEHPLVSAIAGAALTKFF